MTRKEGKFQDILKITCGLSLICFGIVIFTNNFLWFSFTEGWYNSWIDLGSLSSIYDSGFPFPPIYIIFYKFFLNIFDIFSIDRYFQFLSLNFFRFIDYFPFNGGINKL